MKPQLEITIPEETVIQKIYLIRGQKVMLDSDLAELYGVETKQLKRQVRRNIKRFPDDFMFELTQSEFTFLRSHFGTSRWGGSRYVPMAFTELGVSMLSSILNSDKAISVNIQIMRIFSKMRELLMTHKDVLNKLELLEEKYLKHETDIQTIFNYLKKLIETGERKTIKGFRKND